MRQKSTSKVWNLENVDLNRGRPRPGAGLGPLQFGQEDQIMPMLFDPFEQLREFQRAIDTFRWSGWLGSGLSAGGAYPPINIFRKSDDIIVIVEVPGVRKSDLDIRIERNTLRISGSKSVEYGDKAATHRRERSAGRFDRAATLPIDIDPDKIGPECRDGILALYLPRAEREKPRSISLS